ncbi:MAG: NrfD/PsrC family molybdoenzyme membrane anchor subunit [Acetobacteraceae bacterium]|nr:NrfD/PsrC family molybdoenzyme membrane anchor subunit [Acetobacteraceae bacterium]
MSGVESLASRLAVLEDEAAGADRAQPVIADLVAPDENPGTVTDRICFLVLRQHTPLWWWAGLGAAMLMLAIGFVSLAWLFDNGISVFGNDWPVMWGFPILLYVWWIGIASGGTFVSALFFLTGSSWRTSTNRIAETMMVCAVASAGVYPILHLGRPWFAYWLFPYPNTMELWPQWRSPLVWDFYALLTYVVTSLIFWYVGLLPDLASVRDRAQSRPKQVIYGVLAMGFRGSDRQWRHYRATYGVMAAIMAPVVVSIHSFVGLDFAGGQSPGWHSTQFPPFFVFGALLSGLALVLVLLIALRHLYRLGAYITGRHFDVFGKLLLASSLALGYSYMMDAFSTFYGQDRADHTMFVERVFGLYWPVYWGTILFNILLPQLMWSRRLRLSQPVLLLVSASAIVGMLLERYEIVVTSLHRPRLPSAWGNFFSTIWDWGLFTGTIGLFLFLFLLAIRFLPVVSMAEMRKLLAERGAS